MREIIQESWVYQETLQKGIEQGREEGRKKGREEGREEGIEQGRQQGREEGRKEGIQQGIQVAQQTAISIVAKRFPQLELLAKAIITTISDLNQLQMLTVELSIASSQEHVKQLLLSLVSAA